MPWRSVRPFVRAYVRLSCSCFFIEMNPQTFSPSASPTILLFAYETLWRNSDKVPLTPLTGRRMQVWYEKSRFLTNILLYLGNCTRYSADIVTVATEGCNFERP